MIDAILPGFAAMDLGNEKIFVAVPNAAVRSFGTFTADLRNLAGWLKENNVTQVAMEATGVLWINPHDLLESEGFKVTGSDRHADVQYGSAYRLRQGPRQSIPGRCRLP